MESRKIILINKFSGQQERNRRMDVEWGGGKGWNKGESKMETYNTVYNIDSQWEFAVWLRELKWALWQSRRVGWGGKWEGGDMGVPMADSC